MGIYDAAVKTGNETLDILLTERSLYCEKARHPPHLHGGRRQAGLSAGGRPCAPLRQRPENAVEAVSRLENEEERIISFLVRERRGMLVITVDNNYAGSWSSTAACPGPPRRRTATARAPSPSAWWRKNTAARPP